jgi:hypothetical protein
MPLLVVEDIIAIGCDHDVEYAAKDKDDNPLDTGTATWELVLVEGDQETVVGTGDVPYSGTNDPDRGALYQTVIQSTVTAGLLRRAPYTVRITFVDGGFNDVVQVDLKADYKRGG